MGRAESDGMREREGGRLHGWVHRMSGKGRAQFVPLVLPGQDERAACVCTGASWVIKHKNARMKYLLRLTLHMLPAKYQGTAASCGSSAFSVSPNDELKILQHSCAMVQSNNFVTIIMSLRPCDCHDDVKICLWSAKYLDIYLRSCHVKHFFLFYCGSIFRAPECKHFSLRIQILKQNGRRKI